jgi:RND family efflux transporter MFP subunit
MEPIALERAEVKHIGEPENHDGRTARGVAFVAAAVLVVLLGAGAATAIKRLGEGKVLLAATEKLAVPTVSILHPSTEPADDQLILPGQLQAYVQSPLYARTNGYLKNWYKDIGSWVKQGELLADIETPEVDQELQQAKATRQQIEAQLQLAKISADRWTNLRKSDSVSQQEADQQTSGLAQSEANLAAADANVRRLEQLEGFKHVYAPFSGVLTKRNAQIGMLVNAGSAPQAELFDMAQVDPLRIYVNVPQTYAPSVKVGQKAYLELPEVPGRKFEGKVVRTADAIDPATRTLLTEVDVPNRDHKLMPGAFAHVHFAVPVKAERLTVPTNALLFRPDGARAAVVGADHKIHLKAVQIGRDFGTKVEILGGLSPEDQVVVDPSDSLEDGLSVKAKPGTGA